MPRTTQIFCASTLYGAATLAAAVEAGRFSEPDRRVLLVFNNAAVPETTPGVHEMPGFAALRRHFDEVLSFNDAISPLHPAAWSPRQDDIPLLERYLRTLWRLGDDRVELVLESLQVNPALAFASLFTGAPIHAYADGLMSYGPTRNKIDPLIGTRVRRLLHLDLVPGLRPVLLGEFDVPPEIVPAENFLKVLGALAGASGEVPAVPEGAALLLGQYLSALGILTPDEETRLHVRMMRGAVARGHRTLVFKPHPMAPADDEPALAAEAERLGVDLTVVGEPVLAEVLFDRARPALVVGCFSTALFTASAFYGLPVARIGTGTLLDRLAPFQNSNRIPLVLADALLPDLEAAHPADPLPPERLAGLVDAVSFAMQPQVLPALRPAAERFLSEHFDERVQRYFKRRRLTVLALPGGLPQRLGFLPRNSTARRVARRARRTWRAVRS
ncbi:polysialyltransferase family glycosyltransferase [Streptomyces sp. NPDC088785]|uniref:polysialyltransferase family glycosyltransferase n=1 Tax=Streptomyces sp. NPDC088785 TaxID=3365897 RepID=UPI0038206DC3